MHVCFDVFYVKCTLSAMTRIKLFNQSINFDSKKCKKCKNVRHSIDSILKIIIVGR